MFFIFLTTLGLICIGSKIFQVMVAFYAKKHDFY